MIRQSILAALGACGFGMLFHLQQSKIPIIFAAEFIVWYAYMVLQEDYGVPLFQTLLLLSALIVLLFGMLGRKMRIPGMLFSTPILIPFIPGATLFETTMAYMQQNPQLFYDKLHLLILQVAAIAMGIIIGETIVILCYNKLLPRLR